MTTLPRLTHKFLRTEAGQEADIVVHRFHCWMDAKGLTLQTLMLIRLTPLAGSGNVCTYGEPEISKNDARVS